MRIDFVSVNQIQERYLIGAFVGVEFPGSYTQNKAELLLPRRVLHNEEERSKVDGPIFACNFVHHHSEVVSRQQNLSQMKNNV
jgi:hypothetical protein